MCPLRAPHPVYLLANYRSHLSHFLENVNFVIPTSSLSIYASTLSMRFQAAECNEVNTSLLLNLINNNFLIFFNRESFHFESLLTPKSENLRPILVTLLKMRPHYSHSSHENATPSSGTSPLASCKEVPPSPG